MMMRFMGESVTESEIQLILGWYIFFLQLTVTPLEVSRSNLKRGGGKVDLTILFLALLIFKV